MSDFTVREYAFISIAYEGCPESSLGHAYIPEKHLNIYASFQHHFLSTAQKYLNLQDVES